MSTSCFSCLVLVTSGFWSHLNNSHTSPLRMHRLTKFRHHIWLNFEQQSDSESTSKFVLHYLSTDNFDITQPSTHKKVSHSKPSFNFMEKLRLDFPFLKILSNEISIRSINFIVINFSIRNMYNKTPFSGAVLKFPSIEWEGGWSMRNCWERREWTINRRKWLVADEELRTMNFKFHCHVA